MMRSRRYTAAARHGGALNRLRDPLPGRPIADRAAGNAVHDAQALSFVSYRRACARRRIGQSWLHDPGIRRSRLRHELSGTDSMGEECDQPIMHNRDYLVAFVVCGTRLGTDLARPRRRGERAPEWAIRASGAGQFELSRKADQAGMRAD
jgi:hypothetical protein